MRSWRVAVLLFAGLSLSAQDVGLYSLEKEAALGKQLAAEFLQHTKPIESPAIQEYLNRLGQLLAAQMPDAVFPYMFRGIASDPCGSTHEPIALPGGYVFVSAALFLAVQDEAELAGMLAHAGRPGMGKRGGVRAVYYFAVRPDLVYMLDIYAKSERADLTPADKRELRTIAKSLEGD
jgi:hypothetical protein